MLISIIIPVYNELRTLPEVLRRVKDAVLPLGCTKEVLVIDDGSTDGTTRLVEEYMTCGLVHGYQTRENRGKGSAIREGIRRATGEIILIQDADLEYDPNDYLALLGSIVEGRTDITYGSRFRGHIIGMAWKNWIANKALTYSANILYSAKITDEATAYKAFRASVLRRIELKCQRFEFCPEVTAKLCRLGYKIHEVPIRYTSRTISEGKKVRFTDGVAALLTLILYRLVPIKSFDLHGNASYVGAPKAKIKGF